MDQTKWNCSLLENFRTRDALKTWRNYPCNTTQIVRRGWRQTFMRHGSVSWIVIERERRKILMLVDNCPAHPNIANLKAVTLKFLPSNTTSCLQPMDQGIIQNLKIVYRRLVVEHVLRSLEADDVADTTLSLFSMLFACCTAHGTKWRLRRLSTASSMQDL